MTITDIILYLQFEVFTNKEKSEGSKLPKVNSIIEVILDV